MPGLYAALSSSVSAMAAQSVAISTTGNNLANVNNPSYARETVDLGDLGEVQTPSGPESMGLVAKSVQEVRDSLLDSQVRNADSQVSYYSTLQSAYQQAQAALGQTVGTDATSSTTDASPSVSDSGIGASLDGLFNAFQSYAADPTNSGTQQALLQSASTLTDELQSTDASLAQIQTGLTTQAQGDVTSTNSLLSQIAGLNTQINQIEANAPGTATDLRDQRESDLETLANTMPISVTENAQGEDTVTAPDANGHPVTLISQGSVTNALSFNATTNHVSAGSTVLGLTSGSLQGSIDAGTQGIQTLRDNLNALSDELVTSVNAAYNPSGTGNDFFSASGTTAATISLDPSLTASNLQAGPAGGSDNTTALAVANLATQNFSTASGDAIDGTFDTYYDGAVSGFGQTLSGVNSQVTDQTSIQTIVTNQREAVSGVNLDEEMSNLLMYQRSYEASAQVFQTVDSLLDNVVNTMGVVTT